MIVPSVKTIQPNPRLTSVLEPFMETHVRGHRLHSMSTVASSAIKPVHVRLAKTAIIVGGGIGGLVTAGKLAREGFRVTLVEQNEQV